MVFQNISAFEIIRDGKPQNWATEFYDGNSLSW